MQYRCHAMTDKSCNESKFIKKNFFFKQYPRLNYSISQHLQIKFQSFQSCLLKLDSQSEDTHCTLISGPINRCTCGHHTLVCLHRMHIVVNDVMHAYCKLVDLLLYPDVALGACKPSSVEHVCWGVFPFPISL